MQMWVVMGRLPIVSAIVLVFRELVNSGEDPILAPIGW
jgi:hypothetical protein